MSESTTAPPAAELPSTADLIEIAHHYYGRWEWGHDYESLDRYCKRYNSSPAAKRRHALMEQSEQNRAPWRASLRALRAELPEAYRVWDATAYPLEPSRCVGIIYQDVPQKSLIACASLLVPLYYVYESRRDRKETRTLYNASREAAPIVEVVDREMRKAFGYRRIPFHVAVTRVPDISPGCMMPEDVTLAHALFTWTFRW